MNPCSAICLLVCLMQVFAYVRTEGKYSVIAPGTIHPNDKYTATVAGYHLTKACQIKVGITGPSFNESKVVEVKGNEFKNVHFAVPALEKGDYNLTAEGVNCLDGFKNTTKLWFAKFNTHVRIQTDKGLYKPGDEINYRVIFLDKDLKPAAADKESTIWFEDAKRNRIKEIKNFAVTKGVHTGKFKISEFPIMGRWRLGVSNGGSEEVEYFAVEKYVLPKYVVTVETTESVSVKDGDMQVVVRANYTYGKPLNGKATIILSLESYDEENPPPIIIKIGDMVQGKAKIDLNVKELEAHLVHTIYSSQATITATVEEEFTGVKINGTAYSYIYPYRYAMSCVNYDGCRLFEAAKEKEVMLQLTYVDGTPLKDTKSPIELTYTEGLRKKYRHNFGRGLATPDEAATTTTTMSPPTAENRTFTFKGFINETGFVIFKVTLPELKEYEGYSRFYTLQSHYRDEKRNVFETYQYRESKKIEYSEPEPEESKDYFKILDKRHYTNGLHFFKEDQFTINSSKPLTYFTYNVIGHGNIVETGRVELANKPKVYNLTLTPDFTYGSRFAIYVYYVDDYGEYHYAEQDYHVPYELQNTIHITAAQQVKPGEDVALTIKTAPHSYVGLMAVDQSALLLKSNNDFRAYEFNWVVDSYNTRTPPQGGYTHYPGSTSGCVTLTNADYFYNWTRPDYSQIHYTLKSGNGLRSIDRDDTFEYSDQSGRFGGDNLVRGGGGGGSIIPVRKDFVETWLFDDIVNTDTEEFTWSKKIPDTITSWVITGFAMNSDTGFAVTKDSTKITTFLPFFISIRLPYSVKRGEVINVPALVFNYLEKALDVEVTLDNADYEFEFTEVNNEVIGDQKRTKTVRVPANGAVGVAFMIRPKVLGNVMLKYTAVSPVAGDAIHKSMKVVPEGITQYANRAYFINLKDDQELKSSFELELPEDIVPDSQHVEVGVVGDILGPVLNNLDKLVRLPTGCGEQTMSSLLPNYLVLKYLKNSNRLSSNMETRLRFNMETGYQHLLNYHHKDGSFSSFGPSKDQDKPYNGSTWLTAYVTRSLQQLGEFIDVDQKIVEGGLEYLAKQQATNGSFTEKGGYFYISQANPVSLTSSVLLAFLENKTLSTKYSKEIEKGLSFIAGNEDQFSSTHSQAIATYTLNKAKNPAAKEKLSKLNSLAKTDSDRKWWSAKDRPMNSRWWLHVYSSDVEISSYVLLTLLNEPSTTIDDVFPIIRWLIAQRNSYGGFSSTQDTVVGLQALIEFTKLADYKPAIMEVDIASIGGAKDKKETVKLTVENGILYQNVEMPDKTKSIDFSVKGTGTAMFQIAYQYNILEKDPQPSFTITTAKMDSNQKALLTMSICVEYEGEGEASNMAVLEINTPSGYVVDLESLPAIEEVARVSNTELKNSESLLVVYFDHLYKDAKTCIMFEATKNHNVAMQRPAPIVVYDYYDSSKKATDFYQVESKLCDICEGEEECSKCK